MSEQELMKGDQEQRHSSPEVQSEKELQLIQELVSIRKESNRDLEYEHLSDYRMPPRTHFAMLKTPAVSIKYGRMTFNMAAIRLFEGTVNILPMVHEGKHRLAAVPCSEEESASVEWSRKNKQGKWVNKEIRSEQFVGSIFELMGWDPKCRYKVLGRLVNSDRGIILVFDLDERICFEKGKETYTNPATGEVKQRQVKHYPEYYDDHIGKPYNDYEAERKLNQFENTGSYSDGAADEAVRTTAGPERTQMAAGEISDAQPEQQSMFDHSVQAPAGQVYGKAVSADPDEQYTDYERAVGNE